MHSDALSNGHVVAFVLFGEVYWKSAPDFCAGLNVWYAKWSSVSRSKVSLRIFVEVSKRKASNCVTFEEMNRRWKWKIVGKRSFLSTSAAGEIFTWTPAAQVLIEEDCQSANFFLIVQLRRGEKWWRRRSSTSEDSARVIIRWGIE